MGAIDAYRKARDLKDLDWKPYYPNNIPSNGLEGYYVIVNGDNSARKFTILFQYGQDEDGLVRKGDEPELYILFCKIYPEKKEEYKQPSEDSSMITNYEDINEFGDFIRAYHDIDKAKREAIRQFKMIYMYCMSFILTKEEKDILRKEQAEIDKKNHGLVT